MDVILVSFRIATLFRSLRFRLHMPVRTAKTLYLQDTVKHLVGCFSEEPLNGSVKLIRT